MTPVQLGGGSGSNAALVRTYGRRDPERIDVLDWVDYSAGRAGWFQPDGLHLTLPGAAAFARLIETAGPFAHVPPRSVVLTSSISPSAQVSFPTRPTWAVRSGPSGDVVVRTPGGCGYRLVVSVTALPTSAGGASGASGPTGSTGGAATAFVDTLIPAGAQPGPSSTGSAGAMTGSAWATWHHSGAPSLAGAWVGPTAAGNLFTVLSASGSFAADCPRGTLNRAEAALAALFTQSRVPGMSDAPRSRT
jgi:hypothetical protein